MDSAACDAPDELPLRYLRRVPRVGLDVKWSLCEIGSFFGVSTRRNVGDAGLTAGAVDERHDVHRQAERMARQRVPATDPTLLQR